MKAVQTHDAAVAPTRTGDGAAWRRAMRGVFGAALRLHHYRFIRSRLLQGALGQEDADGRKSDRC